MSRPPLNKRYILMLKWGTPCLVGALVISYVIAVGARREDPAALNPDGTIEGLTSKLEREITSDMVRFTFEDATESTGITFNHFPAVRQSLLPEDMGSGLAWGDYDLDDDLDLFLVNFRGSILDSTSPNTPTGACALYRNDGNGRFTDVSSSAGVNIAVFGLAAAWGDYDNDGDLDIYITCFGANVLFRNEGDGMFTDVSKDAGVDDVRFGAGCAWADYDRDGHIDLYVCNYVKFELQEGDLARDTRQYGSEIPYTINPSSYPPESNVLYHNNGDGTFTDVASEVGVANVTGRSLGVVWFDFDNDDLVDLYVANDVSDNGVFHNRGDGTFEDIGASSLAADYRGAMGLAVGDYEHDGDLDLFVTHWIAQENAYFENMISEKWTDDEGNTRLFFMDSADEVGLGQISLKTVGWATGFCDFDNDGNLDLWVVNGNTMQVPDDNTRLKPQRMHMFWNKSGEGFFEIGTQACAVLAEPFVGRGGAYADYDNDGWIDLAVMTHGGNPMILHNIGNRENHWITLRLRQSGGNTRALGARVTVRCGQLIQTAQVGADGSYLSQHQIDLHFGLASAEGDAIDEIIIRWPDGIQETHQNIQYDRIVTYKHFAVYPR